MLNNEYQMHTVDTTQDIKGKNNHILETEEKILNVEYYMHGYHKRSS